ncbi:hypothetical protein OE810_10710 [Rhodobacteraceae bacterium XHP0102]|nr:hypothetical protein [Rhodobacteraceae bacterium XHP0102]
MTAAPAPHTMGLVPIALRPPATVMRLARMGAAHPTRLSFLRILLRRAQSEGWRYERRVFDLDARGVGYAVYCLHTPQRSYSLVAFSHDLPADQRSDRVIATAWDATFTLFDGIPTADDIARLQANVPLQEAGRITARELSLSRANRSVRLFDHVVACLAEGHQPDAAALAEVGYLMRTTAVYGSSKFGAAENADIATRHELCAPFQAEMMSVWLTRRFTIDLVNHLARAKGGTEATTLAPALARSLGVGNSTGLGMAPFLVRHPALLDAWVRVRETALARVRGQRRMSEADLRALIAGCEAARDTGATWRSSHPVQLAKLADLRRDLDKLHQHLTTNHRLCADNLPWNAIWLWGETHLSLEGQEMLLSILIEPCGALIDDLEFALRATEPLAPAITGQARLGDLRRMIEAQYDWALDYDFTTKAAQARFWYVSEEKLEPRLGARFEEDGAEREAPLGIAHLIRTAYDTMAEYPAQTPVYAFLLAHPDHRHILRRVQWMAGRDYGEIRENLLADDILPIDMMRYKLAFFGANHFDPRSDKWLRISLFAGQPQPDDICVSPHGDAHAA